ncbi:zinc ABC transporter substrate-binding protein, partial [Thermococcus sp.]|uniref:metal ABC transporter solute-binding protein, Zn/Mn family n=1 Tax=Thermococcus sp. TaxID=35749 RepID=UPI002604A755
MKEKVILVLLILFLSAPVVKGENAEKPLVVTTIAPLASIVEDAFNGSVNVVYIIPPGVDPHEYQLTTEQIGLLKKADVIVTTGGHLPIEKKIAELKGEGLFSGKVLLIDDYKREGFRYLREHWYSGKDNPHGVWLDPTNAIAIAKATEKALEETDPANAEEYRSELKCFEERVEAIVKSYRALAPSNATAVIEMPPDQ